MTVRVAQQAGEVLLTGNPTARVAQQAAEVLLTPGTPKARATQQAIEVLRSTWDAYPITVAIANPGAESVASGNEPSSWTETSGDWESVASASGDFPIASAQEGVRFFYQQGAVAEAVLEQTVQLYNVPDADIDAGNLVADLSAWQAHNYPDDQGQVIAEFLDADGDLLGTIATPLQHVAPVAGSRSPPRARCRPERGRCGSSCARCWSQAQCPTSYSTRSR